MPLPPRRQKQCKSGLISDGGPSPDCGPCSEGSDWTAGLPVTPGGLWPPELGASGSGVRRAFRKDA